MNMGLLGWRPSGKTPPTGDFWIQYTPRVSAGRWLT